MTAPESHDAEVLTAAPADGPAIPTTGGILGRHTGRSASASSPWCCSSPSRRPRSAPRCRSRRGSCTASRSTPSPSPRTSPPSLFAMVLSGQWADRNGPLAPLPPGSRPSRRGCWCRGYGARTMWLFVLGRAVQGLGGGLVIVALYVVVGRAYPERLRPVDHGGLRGELGGAARWSGRSPPGRSPSTSAGAGCSSASRCWWCCRSRSHCPRSAGWRRAPPTAADRAPAFDRRRIRLALGISVGAGLLQYAGQDLRLALADPGRGGCGAAGPGGARAAARAAPTGRRAGCRRWCCCAGSRPDPSSPPRASYR